MKYLFFILLLCLNTSSILFCQNILDIPPYNIKDFKWQYFSKDLNFPNDNKGFEHTPYGCMARNNSIESGNFIYILDNTFTALKGYAGWDGFILSKLHKETGELIWYYQHNQHVGVKNFERPNSYFSVNDDGNIEIVTLRDRDTMIKDYPYYWEFIGTPALHVLDGQTGNLIQYNFGKDTTKNDNTRLTGGAKLHNKGNNQYFSLLYNPIKENGLTKDLFQFHQINEILDIEKIPSSIYKVNTDLVTIADNLGYTPIMDKLYSTDTLIILSGLWDIEDGFNSPKEAYLHWLDIRNLESVKALREVDVTDAFARPQKNTFRYNPELIFKPGNIILTQVMQPNSKVPNKYFTWMRWFDNEGNVLGNFPYVKWLDTFYLKIEPIGVKDKKLYVTGRYYNFEENIERYDILEIEPNSNQVKKVGEFLSYNHLNSFFRINIINSKFLENGDVYFDLSYKNKINNDLTYWYMSSLVIKAENLGILSSNKQINEPISWSQIYPNPTSECINIQTDQKSKYYVDVKNVTGILVSRFQYNDAETFQIDVSSLPTGIYYVTISDKKGRVPAMTHKVVKL